MDTAIFSPSSLFNDDEDEDHSVDQNCFPSSQLRTHSFPDLEVQIREFSFHQLNANLLWPGTFSFGEWLSGNKNLLRGRRIIELGSGTGALAIFLHKSLGVDITTSDFDDEEIEENIAYNYSWGETFPTTTPDWDLVIASDILLYVKQYPNLIKTLAFLLKSYKQKDEKLCCRKLENMQPFTNSGTDLVLPWPAFLMSWRRRIGKEEEALFFDGCKEAGLAVEHVGSRVYCISLAKDI